MRLFQILLCSVLILLSCSAPKNLTGKSYTFKSKKRTLRFIFDNDSICRLKNTFHCKDIDLEVKEITTTCKYRRVADKIYLRNINYSNDSCNNDAFIYIPPQESECCDFLNEGKRKKIERVFIGPRRQTEYELYALIPNINIDTVFLIGNSLFLTKSSLQEKYSRFYPFKRGIITTKAKLKPYRYSL